MSQHELTKGLLLNEKGNLNEAGFAFDLVKEYHREHIKANKGRIKEWDYYYVGDQEYGVALTIDDNSYMGMASVSILDFTKKCEKTKSPIKWFTNGKVKLPSSSKDGDAKLEGKGYSMLFKNNNGHRHLICSMDKFLDGKRFECDIVLEEINPNSMVIATPFKKNKHFYYNQKINLLKATGYFKVGEEKHEFNSNTLGVLDWGRGVWTYKNTWYWSSLNGEYEGHKIGFNLGYGFGDTSAASENILFYDKEAYKLEDVTFNIPKNQKGKEEYLKEWTFTSKNGDINLRFTPLIDRYSNTNALIIQSKQHQVFGKFSGVFKVKDKEIRFDNLIGFAEKVMNRW